VLPYALAWIPMVAIAVGNGVLRETTYGRRVGELAAHQISCATAIALFYAYGFLLFRVFPIPGTGTALAVGAMWVGLTMAFEFLFGRFVVGHPWSRLLADYNLARGRLWPLVLLAVGIGPLVLG